MIRVFIILFLLTQSVNADCKYSATADVINDKLVNKKEAIQIQSKLDNYYRLIYMYSILIVE